MKSFCKKISVLLVFLLLAGCGKSPVSTTDSASSTENAVNQQLYEALQTEETASTEEKTEPSSEKDGSVDYDLTLTNSDMVYATVYQMMTTPEQYVGKTFRMEGLYYASYYDATQKYYHYCIIEDALGCCAQGMEFVWDDGTHIYPDEYPADNTDIIVEGTFETYKEPGDNNLYCRLKNASLEIPQ